ncbi:MAG: pilus assembly protein [Acidobacteria bacterium]|nr:pilus assembly protein [Acidobacteriota bacterium]
MTRRVFAHTRARHPLGDDTGQAAVMIAVALIALIGLAAFTIDVGYVLNARKQLQASTDAAAAAAAQELGSASRTAVTAKAREYSAESGRKNAYGNLPNVSTATSFKCLTTIGLPTPCTNPATANAVTVTSTATVPLFLARVLGFNTMNIQAVATGVMKGGGPPPLDVMIIVDTTASMNSNCSGSVPGVSNPRKLDCAKYGVRILLNSLWPCPYSQGNCGAANAGGHVSNPYDEVGLMIFPGLKTSSSMSQEWDCSTNVTSSGNYSSWDIARYNDSPQYTVQGLVSNYKTSATGALNGGGSNLIKAVDWADGNSCSSSTYGLESPGGVGTYFATVITAAQSALATTGRSTAGNVIIFVSDGDAGADSADVPSGAYNNQCQQAITAAAAAKAAGTAVYSVAYEASTSGSSCSTDSSLSAYQTMQQIASDSTKFFSQPTAGDLSGIFQKIAADLTTTRLIDDDAQ